MSAPSSLPFVKMEGAGNDYVFVDAVRHEFDCERGPEIATLVSDRHFGIGSDGLIAMATSEVADVRMHMWNADGSRGAMCGNGVRCLAKLAHDSGLVDRATLTVETDGGVRETELLFEGTEVVGARVDMGDVTVEAGSTRVTLGDREVEYVAGDAGNPHAVVFCSSRVADVPVEAWGSAFQRLAAFPDGVNVEFVHVLGEAIEQRTYERGSGETLACGSGATVAALATMDRGLVRGDSVDVRLRGGTLRIQRRGSRLVMEGPARTVFTGEMRV